jgi:hypothetical protein
MHTLTKVGLNVAVLGLVLAAIGCSAAEGDEDSTGTGTQAVTRCTVRGNPPVTTGCAEGETCAVAACTNSIPATCWGTCQAKPPVKAPKACEGAFNCLCGAPTCVDGEWTCIGDCKHSESAE